MSAAVAVAAAARAYGALVARLRRLERTGRCGCRVLGQVDGLPLLHVRLGGDDTRPRPLLISGTHGDEPAGVQAVLAVLADPPAAWLARLAFDVLPCCNPTGYGRGTRTNAAGVDRNWAFARADVPEVGILRAFLRGRRFPFVLDLHEDWESPGFYLYEHCRGLPTVGEAVVERVAPVIPPNLAPRIEGWPARGGVVTADTSRERLDRGDDFPLVLLRDHTDHKLTTKTPTSLPLAQRVRAQRLALEAVVDGYLERTP